MNISSELHRVETEDIRMQFLQGLMEAKDKCDITISIDCDGQDDINAMNEMVDEYLEGSENRVWCAF